MPHFHRWFRLLVLCLLIPAYGIAAAGVSSFVGEVSADGLRVEGHRTERLHSLKAADAPAKHDPAADPTVADSASALPTLFAAVLVAVDDHAHPDRNIPPAIDPDEAASLMLEHGDTSDDMSDHCLPHVGFAVTPFGAVEGPAATPTHAPDAPPDRLHRPPR